MKPSSVFLAILVHLKVSCVLTYFDGVPGDSDVFRNPNCGINMSAQDSSSCDCAEFGAQCVRRDCRECKCRRTTRIYRSDVRKCLSDHEARDPCKHYDLRIVHSV